MSDDIQYVEVFRMDPAIIADAVFVLRSTGDDSAYRAGTPPMTCIANTHFLPDELEGVMSKEDFVKLITDLNSIFVETKAVLETCFLLMLCPCYTYQQFEAIQGERLTRTRALLDESNNSLAERGYYWEVLAHQSKIAPGYIAQLKVNKSAAAKYQAGRSDEAAPLMVQAVAVHGDKSTGVQLMTR